jgi:hypothetical protein
MQLASADVVVWLIIAIVVGLSKAFGKFQESRANTPPAELPKQPAPPVLRPQPRRQPPPDYLRKLSRPPEPRRVPTPVQRSAVPPRPATEHVRADAAPPTRAAPVPKPAAASPWMEALRDKTNLRNIIISAQIIGPPKALEFPT